MADAERGRGHKNHKKQTAKSKGKPNSRWRKPANLINIGNKEKGECFSFQGVQKATEENKGGAQRASIVTEQRSTPTRPPRVSDTAATTSEQQEREEHHGRLEGRLQGVRKTSQHKRKQVNKFTAAESQFKKRKLDKEQQIKEREVMIQKHREEVREKMKKRRETFGRLNRRTRKGQPIMANQIEHLLGKIQSQT
ncbi:uncharacterized protein LOC144632364 [Oculina patagonica]